MRRRRGNSWVVLLIAVALLADAPPRALAAAPSLDYAAMGLALQVVEGIGTAVPLTPEEEQDVRSAAKRAGIDPDESAKQHVGANAVAVLATELELEQPAAFVQWGISRPEEPGRFWMLFKSAPDSRTLGRIADLPGDIAVLSGAPASSAELAALAGAIVGDLAGRDVFAFAGSKKDRYAKTMTIEYSLKPDALASVTQDDIANYLLTAKLAGEKSLGVAALGVRVLFIEVPGAPAALETVVQGGRTLYKPDNTPWCTGGFTAEVNGQRGILTAQHCPSDQDYNSLDGVISESPVNATDDASGGDIDIQWHRTLTGHSTNKDFRATSTAESGDRTVTDVANAGIGSAACHWGWASGNSCSYVDSVNDCILFAGGRTNCGIDSSEQYISQGGDSGGPWFFGTTARGIHAGGGAAQGSMWTRISRVALHLPNAFVLQN